MRKFCMFLTSAVLAFMSLSCSKSDEEVFEESKGDVNVDAVDLGLSVKWAAQNVGADSPSEVGTFFAWGETRIAKDRIFSWDEYKWGKENAITKYCKESEYGTMDSKGILEKSDDAAYVIWGADWRMPSVEEWEELISECEWEWDEVDGQYGYMVYGTNGNSIFLPAAGTSDEGNVVELGVVGYYWANSLFSGDSNHANFLHYRNGKKTLEYKGPRYKGMSVRPVLNK